MSGNAEDDAKARLEVAQLYEGMPGQAGKAARYYFAAAEIFRGAGVTTRARELYQKVLQLEPGNAQAQAILQTMVGGDGAPAAPARPPVAPAGAPISGAPRPPGAPPAGSPVPAAAPPPPAPGSGKVMIPTPWICREPRYVAAARGQLQQPPDPRDFPWDPLPGVDPAKVAARAEARKVVQKEVERKTQTRVVSQFEDAGASRFGKAGPVAGGAASSAGAPSGRFGAAAKPLGTSSAPAPATPAPAAPAQNQPPSRFGQGGGAITGGNRDLADAIRRKMQGG